MRCERCQGDGFLRRFNGLLTFYLEPCPECYMARIVSCCEGSARHGQLPATQDASEHAAGECQQVPSQHG